MKRAALYVMIFCMAAASAAMALVAHGEETPGALSLAKQHYDNGDYDNALAIYTGLCKDGIESGPIYFNAGNCYLQKGENTGKAIFFYEMARRLMPRDPDLSVNLRYARSLMKQADPFSAEPFILTILKSAFDGFTLGETFIIWNIAYFGFAILFLLSLFVGAVRRPLVIAAIILLCLTLVSIIPIKNKIAHTERAGFIITPTAEARLEPFEDAALKFTVYEGNQVRVLKTTKKWYKIKCPDGKIGWIPIESLWQMAAPLQ